MTLSLMTSSILDENHWERTRFKSEWCKTAREHRGQIDGMQMGTSQTAIPVLKSSYISPLSEIHKLHSIPYLTANIWRQEITISCENLNITKASFPHSDMDQLTADQAIMHGFTMLHR